MSSPNTSEDYHRLKEVFDKIQEIAENTVEGDFIYRGESQHFEKVSSSLWRECSREFGAEHFNIETIQHQMLEFAKDYTNEIDEFEILTGLQHFGGYTNLVDFTTDYHIAMFFACDGSLDKHGRIILLERTEETNNTYQIEKPRNPQNRIIAQKSIFVRPPDGYVKLNQYKTIDIPGTLKERMLDHLHKHNDISTQTIYNDLHGFIRNQRIHLTECVDVYRDESLPKEDSIKIDTT